MLFDLLGMAMLDGLATVFNSPFIIPVAGCVMILGMTASSMWAKVRSEEIKSHERLARIAQGLPVETEVQDATMPATGGPVSNPASPMAARARRPNDGGGARRAGFVLVSIGVGLFAFFAALATILQVRAVLCGGAAGLIPLAIGIGFLIDARLKRQDYERHLEWERSVGTGRGMTIGLAGSTVPPPPPPVGLSAAQASDWRPLH